jgi:hypothetical protein
MLVEAETTNDKDFIALSALMRAATSLYRMDRQRPSYLQVRAIVFHHSCSPLLTLQQFVLLRHELMQEFVKDFTVWKNSDFWEEYFLRTLSPHLRSLHLCALIHCIL